MLHKKLLEQKSQNNADVFHDEFTMDLFGFHVVFTFHSFDSFCAKYHQTAYKPVPSSHTNIPWDPGRQLLSEKN